MHLAAGDHIDHGVGHISFIFIQEYNVVFFLLTHVEVQGGRKKILSHDIVFISYFDSINQAPSRLI